MSTSEGSYRRVPTSFHAGDTVRWRNTPFVIPSSLSGESVRYFAGDYTLKHLFRGSTVLDVTGRVDKDSVEDWISQIKSEDSMSMSGSYWVAIRIIGKSEDFTVDVIPVTVKPNFQSAGQGYDGRSSNQRELEAVNKAIKAILLNDGVVEYYIKGRRARYQDLDQLRALRTELYHRVWMEKHHSEDVKIQFR